MEYDEALYKAYLEEMNALENFRLMYAAQHPTVALDRDDPDVKRLVEALAFFSARTYRAGASSLTASQIRIFQQFFPFLLSSLPSMGLVQADVTSRLQESSFVPRGTEISVSALSGETAIYRTMEDLDILPVTLTDARLLLLPVKGFRLLLTVESQYKRSDVIGTVSFHIDYLNNYQTSLRFLETLKASIVKSVVVFDDVADETSGGTPCQVYFGKKARTEEQLLDDALEHPMQKARRFFHFPFNDLYMHIDVPQVSHNWQKFTLCLDLDASWPKSLVVNKEIFRLHTIPVENLRAGASEPFIYDGTQERFPIRHPEVEMNYELQYVIGVYKIENGIRAPLKPGILSGGEGSYEIEYSTGGAGTPRHWLHLHYSEAFNDPITIYVEGLWIQSGFSENLSQKLDVSPYSRHVAGVNWEVAENIVPHSDTTFHENMDVFMHLLTLRNKAELTFEDISTLILILGSVWKGNFKPVEKLFKGIRIEQAPLQESSGSTLKHLYILMFKECEPGLVPMVKVFTRQLGDILDGWISDAPVETKMEVES